MSTTAKQQVAKHALDLIPFDGIVGVGTGSTVNCFIEELATIKNKIAGTVSSSSATTQRLKKLDIPVLELNQINELPIYIDGADEIDQHKHLLKGGGGALTREKIIASAATKFVCIADQNKQVEILGKFPLPIEVIPMARSFVAREIIKLGGTPEYRQGVTTDNNHVILDIHNLQILNPLQLEQQLNNIPGVVCNGLFAQRRPDLILIGTTSEVLTL